MISETISHYRVIKKLGAGGMGEVYKAQDSRLDRPVALKILPAHLVEDPDRVRRFVQEAKAASALNHPHIVTIYEIGQSPLEGGLGAGAEKKERNGSANSDSGSESPTLISQGGAGVIHYIAMEFVDGATLHAKIHRDRADLKKLLEYMAQAGEGLAKAHAAGIVHRDLKPENIMVTEDDYAKILDFGLAKLIEPKSVEHAAEDLEEAATAMMEQTRPGMVMGTIGYMSPEQVQGKGVDQRSDIFSFGCILYEIATGIKPFAGDSVIDSLHRIVYAQTPPIKDANPNAPVELQRIIRKCLAKDSAQRYQSIKDVALDLRDLLREYDSQPTVSGSFAQPAITAMHPQTASTGPHSHPPITAPQMQYAVTGAEQVISGAHERTTGPIARRGFRPWAIAAGVMLILAVAAAIFYFQSLSRGNAAPAFESTRITKLTSTGKALNPSISPNGKDAVYVVNEAGQQSLWVRRVGTTNNAQLVPPAEVGYQGATFSNDGNYVYYTRADKGNPIASLYQVSVLGGSPRKILEDVDSPVTFSPDGKRFAFLRGYPRESEFALMVANSDGSGEQKLVVRRQPNVFLKIAWSPDGRSIACSAQNLEGGMHHQVIEVNAADGTERVIGSHRWGAISGLAWLSDGSGIMLSAIDRLSGSNQFQIYQLSYPEGEIRRITNDLSNYAGVSLPSDSSALLTAQTNAVSNIWIAPNGDSTRARQLTSGSSKYDQTAWTPDGRIVYVSDASGGADIYIMDSEGKNQKQLTADAGINVYPSISPDGRYIVFNSNRAGNVGTFNVWRMDIDGSNPKQLTDGEGDYWPICSPDGKWVLYSSLRSSEKPMTWKVPMDGGERVQVTDKFTMLPVISPDGKTILCRYFDEQTVSLPKLALFSADSGQLIKVLDVSVSNYQPGQYRWSLDGKSILYASNQAGVSNVWSLPLSGGAAKQITDFKSDFMFNFDWSRDGKNLSCARGVGMTDVVLIKDLKAGSRGDGV